MIITIEPAALAIGLSKIIFDQPHDLIFIVIIFNIQVSNFTVILWEDIAKVNLQNSKLIRGGEEIFIFSFHEIVMYINYIYTIYFPAPASRTG